MLHLNGASPTFRKVRAAYAPPIGKLHTFRVESSEAVTNFMSLGERATVRTESLWAEMSCKPQIGCSMASVDAWVTTVQALLIQGLKHHHDNLQDTQTASCSTCASSSLGVHSRTSPESSELSSHLSLCVKVIERIGAVCACAVHTCISSQLSLCISLFKLKSCVCTLSRWQCGSLGQE